MTGIVGGIAHFCRRAERVADPLGGAFIVGSKGDTHMAVVENGVVLPIGPFDLVERLRNQECFQAVAGHSGWRRIMSRSSKAKRLNGDRLPDFLCR